jgi:CO/xanthine dehydrogenase Mo-binding subunit
MKRRDFLKASGALIVSFSARALGQEGGSSAAQAGNANLPGSLKAEPMLDGWIRINADGSILVMTGKAELGQGIKTALLQIAAQELVVLPSRITLISADTERTANEGYTAGSHSMQDSGTAIRNAAAQVRVILVARAAEQLACEPSAVELNDGVCSANGGSVHYGELIGDQVLHVKAQAQSQFYANPTAPQIGISLPRVDIPAKVSGGSAYVQDLRFADMVHARVIRPPSPSAQLVDLDSSAVLALPGVLSVVRNGRFVAVLGAREFDTISAMKLLSKSIRWSDAGVALPDRKQLYSSIRSAAAERYVILDRSSSTTPPADGNALSATYLRPYQMHGSIGPSCAIAVNQDGKTTVWSHTQGVFPLRKAIAELLGCEQALVHCIHSEGAGCYGHNGADDVAGDAALLARAMPGRHVRVQWMREDEHGWEPLAPPMIVDVTATLSSDGTVASWQHDVFSNTHTTRPGGAGDLLCGTLIEPAFKPTTPKPIPQPEGGGDRNAIPLYQFDNVRVVHHFVTDMPRRVSAMRGLGAYANVFAIESFMDELAVGAASDPVAFRLRHMRDARARAVIQLAAERFGWNGYAKPQGRGRGFAFARYKNLGAYLALAIEVELWRDIGRVRVVRAVAAVDSGEVVSPDGIRNQIEGGVIQSISWSTLEEVRFSNDHVASLDWAGYPILRFADMPESLEVHIIDQPGQPFLGTGEASQGPTAAAIGNAIMDATGLRCRQLPFSVERLRAALIEGAPAKS